MGPLDLHDHGDVDSGHGHRERELDHHLVPGAGGGGDRGQEPDLEFGPAALIATTEHSELCTRWIYDAETDPVWVGELLRLVETDGVSEPSLKPGVGSAQARGRRLNSGELSADQVTIELSRVVSADHPAHQHGTIGLVLGSWFPDSAVPSAVTGCLAVVRERA